MLALWLVMSHRPDRRRLVAVALVALLVAAAGLMLLLPRAAVEIALAAPVLGMLTVLAGRRAERRRTGPPAAVLGVWVLVVWVAVLMTQSPTPFQPSVDHVLPAPAGLQATVRDGSCQWLYCEVRIDVAGRPGQSGDALQAELREHLKARGWGDGCRPVGWLLDGSTECVELAVDGNRATINLLGNREAVRDSTI
jgi:hypothetical protein